MFFGTPFQILNFACAQQFVHTWGKVIWKGSAVVAKSTIIIEYYNCVSKHIPHTLSSPYNIGPIHKTDTFVMS